MKPKGIALYRLPFQQECSWIRGEVEELPDYALLSGRSGFVFAPFAVSDSCPVALIHPTESGVVAMSVFDGSSVQQLLGGIEFNAPEHGLAWEEGVSDSYPFETFHDRLLAGDFQKIVLARSHVEERPLHVSLLTLFRRACDRYPRLMVALVYTPKSGWWLLATPEILLEGCGRDWSTMALAGTMRLTKGQAAMNVPRVHWSKKNLEEQRLVASYIGDSLQPIATDVQELGPYTSRAANLVHLRSDFTFRLADGIGLGGLISALHPTPAVCGLPKKETYDFIVANEPVARQYYSGFFGLLSPSADTHLYVSLRCMQILPRHCILYAGGGLMKDSICEKEWEETEAKMETMKGVLR